MFATPKTFTAKTRSHSSGVDATTSPTAAMPALLHSTSTAPCSASMLVAASAHDRGSVTSKPSRRSSPITVSPRAPNASTMAVPMPPRAPVTTITRCDIAIPPPSSSGHHGAARRRVLTLRPMTRITGVRTLDVRAPTSRTLAGSDAVHTDPDYSGAYVFLETDGEHEGVGMTFTIGAGNDLCCAAIELLAPTVVGLDVAELVAGSAGLWRRLTNHSQLRWLGPEKGVIHLATAAIVNAVWDLAAKDAGKPLWQLLADLPPAELVDLVDFRYLTDVLDRDEALDLVG